MATKTTSTTDNNAGYSPCTPEAHQRSVFQSSITDFFGEPIHSYSRSQAIDDGVLIDISSTAREAGFRCPVAISLAAWVDCVEWDEADSKRQSYQDESGRLWDVLWMASQAARKGGMEKLFQVYRIPRGGRGYRPRLATLKMLAGPGDNGELVITILMQNED